MFALTIDQRGSRLSDDGVPGLLDLLAGTETVRAFERTVGDEVQGLVSVRVGDVDSPTPPSVRAARGPALFAARVAVERAARCTAGVALEAGEGRDAQDALDAETVLQVLGRLVVDRSPDGQEAVDEVRRHATQRAAAEQLGITPQAMSARLQVARRDDEDRLRALAVRLLARADAATS